MTPPFEPPLKIPGFDVWPVLGPLFWASCGPFGWRNALDGGRVAVVTNRAEYNAALAILASQWGEVPA